MLAEWFQMHDLHEPFAMGPPSKNQPCCKVENEMTSRETCECGKLFPRCLIKPGCGKISEDPRRRELYRVWLSRNCPFINNYIPLLVVATASNMDFQPTTTKFGVIEYMTKYMTKTHHGSLITIMMDSFAKCMEQATEQGKGLKSAAARYFNLQATQDAKCQGETMHLNFRLPGYLCSRSFTRLSTKNVAAKVLKPSEVKEDTFETGKITHPSNQESYYSRFQLAFPTEASLLQVHVVRKLTR